jgi:predicted DNA-binding transcriptional regulator AlpA
MPKPPNSSSSEIALTSADESIPSSRAIPPSLHDEVALAAAAVVDRVLSQLLGRIISPRIKLLDLHQVCEAMRMGRSTILQMVERGKFPKPQRNLGKHLWRESALIAWLDANDPNGDQ